MKNYKLILIALIIFIIVSLITLLPTFLSDNRIKNNYIKRKALIDNLSYVNGRPYYDYIFYIDSMNYYSGNFYSRGCNFKIGDTITVAYEKGNIKNNYPIYLLFKNSKIREYYKHEFEY